MNNDSPKEGVVIDVTPEPETPDSTIDANDSTDQATTAAPDSSKKGTGKSAGLALLLAVIALGLTLAGGWFGYQQWQQLQSELTSARDQGGSAASETRNLAERLTRVDGAQQALGDQLSDLKSDMAQTSGTLADVQRQFAEQQELLTRERSLLDERETELRSLVAGLNQRVGRSGSQWLVAEADYLLHLADHRLRLAADPTTARAALALADARLHATGDPGWAGVREQIARDLTTLDTLNQPDITGLWSRLGALIEQVPNLKLNEQPRTLQGSDAPSLSIEASMEERTWRTLLSDLWQGIKSAVRIRRNDAPVEALLPPEQEYFLYENLRLRLEQGRLALVQGRSEIYRESLIEARRWLTSHFAADAVSGGLDNALGDLIATPISVSLPDLSASLRALQARRELLRNLPAPSEPATQEAPAA